MPPTKNVPPRMAASTDTPERQRKHDETRFPTPARSSRVPHLGVIACLSMCRAISGNQELEFTDLARHDAPEFQAAQKVGLLLVRWGQEAGFSGRELGE